MRTKNRIISILLTAVMAISSLPLALSASTVDSDDTAITLDTAKFSPSVSPAPVESETAPGVATLGNKYLSVYNPIQKDNGFTITFDAEANTTYKLTYKARYPLSINSNYKERVEITGPLKKIDDKGVVYKYYWDTYSETFTTTDTGTVKIKVFEHFNTVTAGTENTFAAVYPVDYDDIKVVKVIDADTESEIMSEDFENVLLGTISSEWNKEYTGGAILSALPYIYNDRHREWGDAQYAVLSETAYSTATVSGRSGAMTYTDSSVELPAGTYTLTGYFRNNEVVNTGDVIKVYTGETSVENAKADESKYITVWANNLPDDTNSVTSKMYNCCIIDNNNSFSLKATVKGANGKTYGADAEAVLVTTGWTQYTLTFEVSAATTLDKIDFAVTHSCTSAEKVNLAFYGLTLSCDPAPVSLEGNGNIGILMMILAKKKAAQNKDEALANYTVSSGEQVKSVSAELDGNKYLSVSHPTQKDAGFTVTFDAVEGTKYTVSYDARIPVDFTGDNWNRYSVTGATEKIDLKTLEYTSRWDNYSNEFTASGDTVTVKVFYQFKNNDSNGSFANVYPVDYDNIKIVDNKGNVIINETFDGETLGTLEAGYTKSYDSGAALELLTYVYNKKHYEWGDADYAILSEANSYSTTVANGGSLIYTDDTVVLEAGTYTLVGYFRSNLVNNTAADMKVYDKNTAVDAAVADESKYITVWADGVTAGKQYNCCIIDNNNSFMLKAVVTDANGNTYGADAEASLITTGWAEYKLMFTVEEATTLASVDFEMVSAYEGAEEIEAAFRGIAIVPSTAE